LVPPQETTHPSDADVCATPTCPVCHAPASLLWANLRDLEYFMEGDRTLQRCDECAVVFLHPMPTREELPALYPPNYQNFDSRRNAITGFLQERYFQHHCDIAMRHLGPGDSFLEVGCAGGDLLERLSARGIDRVVGVEISDDACAVARAKGLHVFHGTLEELQTDQRFDVIFMSHVVEHVVDPVDTLRTVHDLLRPGGVVYIETPNVGALDARTFGPNWGLIHFPRHTYLFDKRTIAGVVRRAGLTVVEQGYEINSCGWALSLQSALRRRGWDRSRKPRSVYYPLLLVGFLPLNLIDFGFGGPAFMSLVARREAT
jgi:SAM-dependent methyltransferase